MVQGVGAQVKLAACAMLTCLFLEDRHRQPRREASCARKASRRARTGRRQGCRACGMPLPALSANAKSVLPNAAGKRPAHARQVAEQAQPEKYQLTVCGNPAWQSGIMSA